MNCLICQTPTVWYFAKTYEGLYAPMMADIGPVQYWKCPHCGFVLSKTHADLPPAAWQALNQAFHHHLEDPANAKAINQPPYAEQALMLHLLAANGVVSGTNMLDYAGGYGTLSRLMGKYHGMHLPVHDPYVTAPSGVEYIPINSLGQYSTVINSAMFEHVLTRADLDLVNNLVTPGGALVLHTVICERVPPDPNWFYLVPPVHTAFHTNASMGILLQQWGYGASIYCPPAKCWILLKGQDHAAAQAACATLNRELQAPWFHFKQGFVDYWKGF
jgi:hypothetical protein